MMDRLVGLLAAGLLSVSCAVCTRPPAANADPGGVWTLTGIVEEDGSSHPPGGMFATTCTVDMAARTIVNRSTMVNVSPPQPDMVHTFAFTVTPEGHWRIEDAGPGGRRIEFAVECTPGTLTLTRVWYEGPDGEVPPPAAYREGSAPPPAPAKVPPPRKFLLTR